MNIFHWNYFIFIADPTFKALITFLGESCICKDLINSHGVGNCKGRKPTPFQDAHSACYVVQPSNCNDLINSITNPGEQLSAEACYISGI